jgi:predicted amidophosphoribosyltransferase
MAFKRALWHSGLTYQQTCRSCNNVVTYQDDKLDFRPWYADGFVYCPVCKTPLRHNENYAIGAAAAPEAPAPAAPAAEESFDPRKVTLIQDAPADNKPAAFCTQCGKKANPGDRFCSGCGNKLF